MKTRTFPAGATELASGSPRSGCCPLCSRRSALQPQSIRVASSRRVRRIMMCYRYHIGSVPASGFYRSRARAMVPASTTMMIARPNRKPTIATVATKAKVAPMTVSRVLNGGYVSADVRARVERVIKELGYVPSPTARSLKYGRRGSIGVAVESVQGPWFMGLLSGIEEELAKKHVSALMGGLRLRDQCD